MNQDKYNLIWHEYTDHLKEMLHAMMKSSELTDVTFVMTRNNSRLTKLFLVLAVQFLKVLSVMLHRTLQ